MFMYVMFASVRQRARAWACECLVELVCVREWVRVSMCMRMFVCVCVRQWWDLGRRVGGVGCLGRRRGLGMGVSMYG